MRSHPPVYVGPMGDAQHVDDACFLVDTDDDAICDTDVAAALPFELGPESLRRAQRILRKGTLQETKHRIGELRFQAMECTDGGTGELDVV